MTDNQEYRLKLATGFLKEASQDLNLLTPTASSVGAAELRNQGKCDTL